MITEAKPGEKTAVFISYAREDMEFVLALVKGLEQHGIEPVGDWLLTPGQKYELRLKEMSLMSQQAGSVLTAASASTA